jgi:alkyldihydroxyacetonephosphate synthase
VADTVRFSPSVTVDDGTVERLRATGAEIVVDEQVLDDAGRDWWPITMVWERGGERPAAPAVVVRPTEASQVAAVLQICSSEGVPVTPFAGRSGVCGASLPVFGGVSLDLTAMTGIVSVDDQSLLVDVRPGTFGHHFEEQLRAEHGLTVGHWPQSVELSTVGGWAACRGAGQYSTRYGKIEDMVVGLEVALADGSVIRTGGAGPRAAVGPDLTQLFVGSEGTLGVITEVQLRAHPVAPAERRAAYAFSSFAEGLDACRRILRRGATPAVLRLYDKRESKRSYEEADACSLIVLDEGDPTIVDATLSVVAQECAEAERRDEELVARWLSHRNDVSGLGKAVDAGVVVDTCEIAARWSALPAIYEEGVAAVKAVDGAWVCSAHQSHSYTDGACLYFTFAGQREGDPDGFYRDAWNAVSEVTLRHGGALSHHHGIGINRGRFMADALGTAFPTLVALKAALDPAGVLNPGKLGLPSPFGAPPWP